ncbi:hypothetical protein CEXT_557221 [Caerostris extrusa]|uniref:Uncharacterized protein n=1 Tax=Caerostris extrusa TaxID=172846 RepID=A0AAV4M611_CAEEX|nr:hypothetical protein CEXT_557221 [Caerostris extrusa]
MNLFLTSEANLEEQIQIQIALIDNKINFCNCTILLDIAGNLAESIQDEIYFKSSEDKLAHKFPIFLTKISCWNIEMCIYQTMFSPLNVNFPIVMKL